MSFSWEPELYKKFEAERNLPCADLIARLPMRDPQRIVDLGCGPGNSTELLARKFPRAKLFALDNSAEMLATARQRVSACEFIQADIATWQTDEKFDLIFANASLQWIENLIPVMKRLAGLLHPGGVLAAQMPRARQLPLHLEAKKLSQQPEWAAQMKSVSLPPEPPPPGPAYASLSEGNSKLTVWETEYEHLLPSAEHIVQWIRGTGLRPYLDALSNTDQQDFLAAYTRRIRTAYPLNEAGCVTLKYTRVFVMVEK